MKRKIESAGAAGAGRKGGERTARKITVVDREGPVIAHVAPWERVGLTSGEATERDRLAEHRRAEWSRGRAALRRAVAGATGIAADALDTETDASDLPRLSTGFRAPGPAGSEVRTSITHRDGWAFAAADRRRRVGVDLERLHAVDPDHTRYFATEQELATSGLAPTQLWSLKEAAWKALRCDDSTPFTDLRLHFSAGELSEVRLGERRFVAGGRISTDHRGYVLAVVWLEEGE